MFHFQVARKIGLIPLLIPKNHDCAVLVPYIFWAILILKVFSFCS